MNGSTTKEAMETFTEGDPLQPNGDTKHEKSSSFCQKIQNVRASITVEPTMALFVLACVLSMLTTQNLSIEKACRVNLNFTEEICDSLKLQQVSSENEYEKEVQKLTAKFISSRTYITATVPCIIALFAGSYSDNSGKRKIFLIIPVMGQILLCINNMLNVYFFYQMSLGFLTFSEAIFEGFSGGWCLPCFIMFAYVSVISTEQNRTFRLGILNFAMTVGFPIGMGLSGVLIKNTGYYGSYGVVLGFHLINLIYIACIVKEPPRSVEQKRHDNKGLRHFLRMFFSLKNVKEASRVMFSTGPNMRRMRMITYLLVVCTLFGPLYGEVSVMYLLTRYRFNWDEVKFSMFQCYNFLTHTVGTIFSIIVFSKVLGWHDSMLGIISVGSKIASSFIYCFAPNGKIFLIAPLVEVLNGTSFVAMRSLISKLVQADELGKVSSIISLAENLMPLLYVPLYTNVYKATMDVLPGTVFLVGAALIFPAFTVFIWLFYEHRKGMERKNTEISSEMKSKEKESLMLPT